MKIFGSAFSPRRRTSLSQPRNLLHGRCYGSMVRYYGSLRFAEVRVGKPPPTPDTQHPPKQEFACLTEKQ